MLSLLVTLTAVSVHAQSKRTTINIPFNFTVGQTTLPAGEYTIEPNRKDSPDVWLIQSTSGQDSVLFTTGTAWAGETQKQTKLVFNNYEGQYFLAKIWNAGDNSGRVLRKPRVERQLAKNGVQREVVVVTPGPGQ
jgi:hypothetical protein